MPPLIGPGYVSAGAATMLAVVTMIATGTFPPAVSTAMSFGLKSRGASTLSLFVLALLITVALLAIQRLDLWLLRRFGE